MRALACILLTLAGCSSASDQPGGMTSDEARQLNDAAAMLDAERVDVNVLGNPAGINAPGDPAGANAPGDPAGANAPGDPAGANAPGDPAGTNAFGDPADKES